MYRMLRKHPPISATARNSEFLPMKLQVSLGETILDLPGVFIW